MHGHIEVLLEQGIDNIFYPCMSYNFDEKSGDNCYNCPVVTYYPELLKANVSALNNANFYYPYFSLFNRKEFTKRISSYFNNLFSIPGKLTKKAVQKAYMEYLRYKNDIIEYGQKAIKYANDNNLNILVLTGRPTI